MQHISHRERIAYYSITVEPVMSLPLASNTVATVLEWLAAYGESH